jgi:uncharacterized membrane protein
MSTHGTSAEHGAKGGRVGVAALLLSMFLIGFLAPSLVYAAPKSFADLVWLIIDIINPLVGLLISVALLFFFFNIIRYISTANQEKKGYFRENLVWSIIAMFVLVSFFGLARILQNTLAGSSYNNPYPESGTR